MLLTAEPIPAEVIRYEMSILHLNTAMFLGRATLSLY